MPQGPYSKDLGEFMYLGIKPLGSSASSQIKDYCNIKYINNISAC